MLIFVYNADSGRLNLALDIAHKVLSPATYQCQLCALTHGVLRERAAWTAFRARAAEVGEELVFLHRDEFAARHAAGFQARGLTLPAVLRPAGDLFDTVLSSDDLRALPDLDSLIRRLDALLPGTSES